MLFQSTDRGITCFLRTIPKQDWHSSRRIPLFIYPDSIMSKKSGQKESIKFWFPSDYTRRFSIMRKANGSRRAEFVPISRRETTSAMRLAETYLNLLKRKFRQGEKSLKPLATINVNRRELASQESKTAMEITPSSDVLLSFWLKSTRARVALEATGVVGSKAMGNLSGAR